MVTVTNNVRDELRLIGKGFTYRTVLFTAAGALTFPRGMVLGRITATGKVTFYLTAAGDGTEIPFAVLADELVAPGVGDTSVRIITSGEFREDDVLVWTAGTPVPPSIAERDLLQTKGLYLTPETELSIQDNQ